VATLTGAARVAMGFDVTPFMSQLSQTRDDLWRSAECSGDPLWPLPMWRAYDRKLKTPFADINKVGNDAFGGAIIAACFLARFVKDGTDWVHIDLAGWDHGDRPGTRKGAAMAGWWSVLSYIEERYGVS